MMVGFFDVAVPGSVDKQRFFVRAKKLTSCSMSDLTRGTVEVQFTAMAAHYLQFDYAPPRILAARAPLC